MKVSLKGKSKKGMSSLACKINSKIPKEEEEYNKKLSELVKKLHIPSSMESFAFELHNLNMKFKRETGFYYYNIWDFPWEQLK